MNITLRYERRSGSLILSGPTKIYIYYYDSKHVTFCVIFTIMIVITRLAQLVERRVDNAKVASSNLALGTTIAPLVKLVDTPDLGSGAERCESSSLSWSTNTGVSIMNNTIGFYPINMGLTPVRRTN